MMFSKGTVLLYSIMLVLLMTASPTVAAALGEPEPHSDSSLVEGDWMEEKDDDAAPNDEIFLGDTSTRNLQLGLPPAGYADPLWWQDVKDVFGKQFKRCKWQKNVAPQDGSACPRKRNGEYFCMFADDQEALCPETKCDCENGENGLRWKCKATGCGDFFCPTDEANPDTPPENGSTCNLSPEVGNCYYGEVCCPIPGTSPPELDCLDDSRFNCACIDGKWDCSILFLSCPSGDTNSPSASPQPPLP